MQCNKVSQEPENWDPASSSVSVMAKSSREDRGYNFDCIREQFLDLYLNATQLVSARFGPLSTGRCFAPSSFVL